MRNHLTLIIALAACLIAVEATPANDAAAAVTATATDNATVTPAWVERLPRDRPDVVISPSTGDTVGELVANPSHPARMVLGYGDDSSQWLRVSQDNGRTWSPARSMPTSPRPLAGGPLLRYAADGQILYAAYGNIVTSTTDDGMTWSPPVEVLDREGCWDLGCDGINTFVVSPVTDQELYLLTYITEFDSHTYNTRYLIYRSKDGGSTWSLYNIICPWLAWTSECSVSSFISDQSGHLLVNYMQDEYWIESNQFTRKAVIAASTDDGSFADLRVWNGDRSSAYPAWATGQLAVGPRGIAHLIYVERVFNTGTIYHEWSRPPYRVWSPRVRLSDATDTMLKWAPTLIVQPCGRQAVMHAGWQARPVSTDEGATVFYVRRLAAPGHRWSSPIAVSDEPFPWGPTTAIAVGVRPFAAWAGTTSVQGSAIDPGIDCR
ncbi:MAG: sialidase family protein [Rhodospirillales bacterium]